MHNSPIPKTAPICGCSTRAAGPPPIRVVSQNSDG